MISLEWVAVVVPCAGAAVWIVNLMIDNKVLKIRNEELQEENIRLKEYARSSKP